MNPASLQTLNLPHSSGKPGVYPSMSISVRFAVEEPVHLQIKKNMKTSAQENTIHPALFRIAAMIGNPITPLNGGSIPDTIKKEFAALKKEIVKSMTIEKSQPKMPVTACGWSFPIRK